MIDSVNLRAPHPRPFGSAAFLLYCADWWGEFASRLMTGDAEGYSDVRRNRS